MCNRVLLWLFIFLFLLHPHGMSQRMYAPNSVLSSGSWYKISVKQPGVYKIDIPFLNRLGINTNNLPSSSIRLYGNGGAMLPEANQLFRPDDLLENAIMAVDGGDGQLNGSDYLLFYANGPDEWVRDTVNQRFTHRKNIYNNKSYYFITVGGNGKRIGDAPLLSMPVVTVTDYSERYFHELDTVNFLSSGKEWYGEEMSALPGRSLTRTFNISFPNIKSGASLQLVTNVAARSVNTPSRFDIRLNNQLAGHVSINATSGGQYDVFAKQATGIFNYPGAQSVNSISFTYVPGGVNAQGWLNWFELFTRCNISMNGIRQLHFRDWLSVGVSKAEFVVSHAASGTQVWDITHPLNPQKMQGSLSGSEFRFINDATQLREYIAFDLSGLLVPQLEGRVPVQNLHNTTAADLLIVTHESILSQAQRLADIHRNRNNLSVVVVTVQQVYNEFSGGSLDPTAIRDFVKMYYDKYGTMAAKPRYLLLMGAASFDYKDRIAGNTNLVPAWQSHSSLDPLTTYTSDDFFGFLDDSEDINAGTVTSLLDVGIGRIPARTSTAAKNFVDKLENYFHPLSLGPWRNILTFVADDEDGNLHLNDAEIITQTALQTAPVFNLNKIYLDAYPQQISPAGAVYPEARQTSNSQLQNGTLIWNYNGHGGPLRLAEETILDKTMPSGWKNNYRLPLFITSTCDFAPYDNPSINSLGEQILLQAGSGAIALMTTTRPVFAFSNRIMNNNYIQSALLPDSNGRYKSLGEAIMATKNYTYQTSSDIANNRKFTLLGDPAMTLAFPQYKVKTVSVNGLPITQTDTLSATEKVEIQGEITDFQGNIISDFNGHIYPVVLDKPRSISTLANDAGSQPATFQVQKNALFKGKSSVKNGKFSFSFVVPKDINYRYGNGRISYYAEDGTKDANGYDTSIIIGGTGPYSSQDRKGPEIKLWLNDELFINGGITNQSPVLLVKLTDSSGINITGTAIGHDIIATLDNDSRNYFILNDFYQALPNNYQQGSIRFQLPVLEPGFHSLQLKAWDVFNNSGEATLEFVVTKDEELILTRVLNYPNPFSSFTSIWFEHNKPGQPLQVNLQIMTITGRVVKTINQVMVTEGNRSAKIEWDGRDEFGDKLGRGVYIYRLRVLSQDGNKKDITEKLVIL